MTRRIRTALLALVCTLIALLSTTPASAHIAPLETPTSSPSKSADSRLGLDGRIAYCTYRLALREPRLASENAVIGLRRASDPTLRWKGRPLQHFGGTEVYDMRARQWVPEMGAFLSIDEYRFHSSRTSLWGWPGQNPIRWRDPSGRTGVFLWGSGGVATPGPLRVGGELVGLVGVDTAVSGGIYTGVIAAGGVEMGGAANEAAAFYGIERTSDGHTTPISLYEANLGIEIPFVAGVSDSIGIFVTDDSFGWFFGPKGDIWGEHVGAGFGFSISKSWLPDWLTGGRCP